MFSVYLTNLFFIFTVTDNLAPNAHVVLEASTRTIGSGARRAVCTISLVLPATRVSVNCPLEKSLLLKKDTYFANYTIWKA